MPPKPKANQACPVCRQPMKWFGDHWVCTSIKVHDRTKRKLGTVVPFRKRRKKGG